MKIDKKSLLLILMILLVVLIRNFFAEPIDYRKFVWFVWASNFLLSAILLLLQILIETIKYSLGKETTLRNIFTSAFLYIPLSFSHIVIGAFLSFFAQTDPMNLYGPNGFINNFTLADGVQLIYEYAPIFYPYFFTKIVIFSLSTAERIQGWIYIKDAFLALIGAVLFPMLFLSLEKYELDFKISEFSFVFIAIFIFIPWNFLFSKDITAKKIDKEAEIEAQLKFPVEIYEKGPRGWGIFILLFGMLFISVGVFSFHTIMTKSSFGWFNIPIGMMFLLAFGGFGVLASLIGLNFQWGYKKLIVNSYLVKGEQRILLPFPKVFNWTKPITDYSLPRKVIIYHRNKSHYTEYKIVMSSKNEVNAKPLKKLLVIKPDQEIVLYKAYHEDEVEKKLKEALALFGFLK